MPHVLAENCPEDAAFGGVGAEVVTFARLQAQVAGLALGLASSGLPPGSRVLAWTDPSLDYLRLLLAAAQAGLAVIPVDAQRSAAEVGDLAARLDAQALYAGRRQQAASVVAGRTAPVTIGAEPALAIWPLRELAVTGAHGEAGPDAPLLVLPGHGDGPGPGAAVISQRAAKSMCRLNAIAFRLPLRGTLVWPGYPGGLAEFTAAALTHLHVGASIEIAEPAAYPQALACAPAGGLAYAHHGALANGLAADLRHASGLGTIYLPVIAPGPAPGLSAGGHAEIRGLSAAHDDSVLLRGWNPVEHGLALITGWRGSAGRPADHGTGLVPIGTLLPDVEARLARHPGTVPATLTLRSPALMDGYFGHAPADAADGYFDTGRAAIAAAGGMLYTAIAPGVTR
jgi:acyl-CoA synthetase (AMP-forming)/AMP-acid ligase II